jgi:hypothetical protein
MGSSISSALRGSSAATADDLYESMNNFMGVSKGAIANFAGYITTAGDIASGFGTAVNSLIEISLAKGLIDMANTQAEIDVNKASEQNIHIMMTTLNTFTGNSNQSGNGIINDLGQGTALDAQTAAANFSGIWEVQG